MTRVTLLQMSDRVALAVAIHAAWDDDGAVWVVDAEADVDRITAMGDGVLTLDIARRLTHRGQVDDDLPIPADTATIVSSSGTTGPPKVVCLSKSAMDASGRGAHAHLGIGKTDRWGLVLPLQHVAGQSILWRSRMLGRPPVIQRRLDPPAMDATGVTVVSLVPTQLRRLVDDDHHVNAHVLLGGAAIAPDLLAAAADRVGGITRSYGLTETAGGCVYDGIPFPGTEVTVRDGLLGVRGSTLASGLVAPSGLAAVTDDDGWLWTNDIGAVDGDGVVSVVGRADDVVITGGVNVNPASVEVVLADHPAIEQAGVVGVDDQEWGQRLVAAIVLRQLPGEPRSDGVGQASGAALPRVDADLADELRAMVRRQLGSPAAPAGFVVVEGLPLTALGKLARHELATMIGADGNRIR